MKNPDRDKVHRLDALPNVGKKTAGYLNLIGVTQPGDLIGKSPFSMYDQLCAVTGKRFDPCIIDVFMSVVAFMEGEEPKPWWFYTQERKDRMEMVSASGKGHI